MEVTTEFGVVMQDTEANGESDRLLTVPGTVLCTKEKSLVMRGGNNEDGKNDEMDVENEGNSLGKRINSEENEEPTGKITKLGTPSREKGEKQKDKRGQQNLISGYLISKQGDETQQELKEKTPKPLAIRTKKTNNKAPLLKSNRFKPLDEESGSDTELTPSIGRLRFTGMSQPNAAMESEEQRHATHADGKYMEGTTMEVDKEEETWNGEKDDRKADDPAFNITDEYDVSITTEGCRYILRPIRQWKRMIRMVNNKEITVKEAVEQTHLRLGIRAINGQEEATPDEGWSGYVALLQAKWMTEQRTKQDAMICADIRNKEFREELAAYIKKIANGHREMMIAAEVLVKNGDTKADALRVDKQYRTDMDILPAMAGHIA